MDNRAPSSDELIRASDLRKHGASTSAIQTAVHSGSLVRVHRGIYIAGPLWASLDLDDRYRMFVRAVAMSSSRRLVISHQSAAAIHGFPMISEWPQTVHVTVPRAPGGSSQRHLTVHTTAVGEPANVAGLCVTAAEQTVIDVGSTAPFVDAVSVADSYLRRSGPEAKIRLLERTESATYRRRSPRAARAISFADPLSDSAGESLSRVRMHELGFEAPELQHVFAVDGHNWPVDFFWPDSNIAGEFDGHVKYTRNEMTGGRPAAEIVWKEKQREDAIRAATGARFVRWTWTIAMNPRALRRTLVSAGVPLERSPLHPI